MTIARLGAGVARRWWVVVLCTLLGAGLGLLAKRSQPVSYAAQSAVLLTAATDAAAGTLISASPSIAQVATMSTVLGPAAATVRYPGGWEELAKHVTAANPTGTSIVSITATDAVPARAAEISRAVAGQLTTYIGTAPDMRRQLRASLVQPAPVPKNPAGTALPLLLAAGSLAGLLAGVALAALLGVRRRPAEAAPVAAPSAEPVSAPPATPAGAPVGPATDDAPAADNAHAVDAAPVPRPAPGPAPAPQQAPAPAPASAPERASDDAQPVARPTGSHQV